MSTLELREELHNYIEIGDNQFLKAMLDKAKAYIEQKKIGQNDCRR